MECFPFFRPVCAFPFSALLILLRWLTFWQFCKYWVSLAQKADFEPSSYFVQILLVVCQNCLNQLDVNKQSLIRAHCSIVTVNDANFMLYTKKLWENLVISVISANSFQKLQSSEEFLWSVWSVWTVFKNFKALRKCDQCSVISMITIVYGSILRPSSNNWASYRRLKWQIAALFLWNGASFSHPSPSLFHASR
jgi:hypothetical protein